MVLALTPLLHGGIVPRAMRKKKACLFFVYSAVLVGALVACAGAALKYEPHFYRAADVAQSAERSHLSIKFVNDFLQTGADLKAGDDKGWRLALTDGELNCFLQEDFVNYGEAQKLGKSGVSDPRVAFDKNRIRIAFRYGSGFWSTVVSYDLQVWTVQEPNVLLVEVLSRRAGALPISTQAVVDDLVELANHLSVEPVQEHKLEKKHALLSEVPRSIDVTPYRHDGHPVAKIRFPIDPGRPGAQLRCLRVEPGTLTISGNCGGFPGDLRPANRAP
jgi:hypothetical protein